MVSGLSDTEVGALAEVFSDPVSAGQLLDAAGLSRADHPSWMGLTARQFWGEVSRLFAAGVLVDGRSSLLSVAATLYSGNAVFGGTASDGQSSAAGGASVWGVPWPRNPNFVGRSVELARLRERLAGVGSASVLPQALHGLGGVGKTQLAVEYAHRHRDGYEVVWWLAAEQPGDLTAGLGELAGRLGVAAGEVAESARRAVAALAARRVGRWLVVVDNAGAPPRGGDSADPEGPLLSGLLAAAGGGGHVLVTSRDPAWSGVAEAVAVDMLPRPDAVALLRRRAGRLSEAQADRVAELLGDLPLAVEQAGAWLDRSGMSVETYCALVEQRAREILAEGKPAGYPVPVAATWTLAVDRLEDPAAVWLLWLWARCGPEPIPTDLIGPRVADRLPGPLRAAASDPLVLGRLTQTLASLGLVRLHTDGVVLHRLVQAVLRDHTPPADRDVARQAVHGLLAAADPGAPDRPDCWPRYAQLRPHVAASGMVDSHDTDCRRLVWRLAWYLNAAGDYATSLTLARDTRTHWLRILGEDHPDSMMSAANLAATLQSLGDYPAAHRLQGDVLARRRRILGEDHPDSMMSAANLAATLRSLGDYPAARQLQEDVLGRRRRILGEDHPDSMMSAANLATTLQSLGDYRTARQLQEDVLARRRRVLGEDHPDSMMASANLAVTLRSLGEYLAARQLQEDVLGRRRRVLGESHPDSMTSAASLAHTVWSLGDYAAARQLEGDVLAWRRRVLGEDHPDSMMASANLAVTLQSLDEYPAARQLQEDVLARSRRILGEDHPDTVTSAANLAVTLRSLGDYQAARQLQEDVLAWRRRVLGEDHPDSMMASANLAVTLQSLGDYQAARQLQEDVLARRRMILGEDHPDTVTSAANLAVTLRSLGEYPAARQLQEDVLARRRRILGEDHPLTTAVRGAMGQQDSGSE
ncbi:FxSxx-COOH system tetratricopeptide repeat protein [Frankia nepalensis]